MVVRKGIVNILSDTHRDRFLMLDEPVLPERKKLLLHDDVFTTLKEKTV